jgi:hypothetical protein
MPPIMPRPSKRLLLCLFSIACFGGLLFSIAGHDDITNEAGNGDVDANFRRLLGLDSLGPKQKQQHRGHDHQVSPAPAPARAYLPLLDNEGNATAAYSPSGGGEYGSKKKSTQLFVVAAAAALIGAAAVLVVVLLVFLVCRKFRGRRGGAELNGTNKVASEPGPCVLYPDNVKPPSLEAGENGGGKAPPEVARAKEDEPARCKEEDGEDEPKCEEEKGGDGTNKGGEDEDGRTCNNDDGAESVYSSCFFASSHFSDPELRDAMGSFNSPSPSSRWKQRTSPPGTPYDKSAVASPQLSSSLRRAHSMSSSMSALTLMLLGDHERPGRCRSVKSLRFQSFKIDSVKEDEAELDITDATSITTAPAPPPPPAVVKQERPVQTSCGPTGPPPPPPPPSLQKNAVTSSGTGLPPPPAPPPGLFGQGVPLGQNGAPLPKLKPLHWDKVRAVPNRRMVWDRIRSSSFE